MFAPAREVRPFDSRPFGATAVGRAEAGETNTDDELEGSLVILGEPGRREPAHRETQLASAEDAATKMCGRLCV